MATNPPKGDEHRNEITTLVVLWTLKHPARLRLKG